MATISQHISNLRLLLKKTTDDSIWSDRFLYQMLIKARAVLLYQRSSKVSSLSRQNYVGYCMKLCVEKFTDCSCIASADCNVLKSKGNLPPAIVSNTGEDQLIVRLHNGEILKRLSPFDAKQTKYNPALKNRIFYWIEVGVSQKRKLILWNNLVLESVYIEEVVADLRDLENLIQCGDATADCLLDWTKGDFPIDADLDLPMYQIAEQELLTKNTNQNDDENNDNNDSQV